MSLCANVELLDLIVATFGPLHLSNMEVRNEGFHPWAAMGQSRSAAGECRTLGWLGWNSHTEVGFTSDAQAHNKEHVMKVAVIWEFRFGASNERAGLEVIRKIWNDMQQSTDCLDHEIIRDEQEPGHVLVISHWSSSEAAEAVKNRYAAHPNAVVANQLALDTPARWVGIPEPTVPEEREAA